MYLWGPWEETRGDVFFVRVASAVGLLAGAEFATEVGEAALAKQWSSDAQAIIASLSSFWNDEYGSLEATINIVGDAPAKFHQLDVSVILASLLWNGDEANGYGPASDRILATAAQLVDSLTGTYKVNDVDDSYALPGMLIGRYPNDTYTGTGRGLGNPWVLTTNGFAELSYKVGASVFRNGISVNKWNVPFLSRAPGVSVQVGDVISAHSTEAVALRKGLIALGDGYMQRVRFHVAGDGYHLAEEINRYDGYAQGAHDLSWSYTSIITAVNARLHAMDTTTV